MLVISQICLMARRINLLSLRGWVVLFRIRKMNRTYDSSLIYHVIKKYRILRFDDFSVCNKNWWILVIIINPREVFLRWLLIKVNVWRHFIGLVHTKLFVPNCSDFLLIDTVVGSFGKFFQIGFLVAPSEHSYSITRQMNLLKLTRTGCCIP